MKLYLSSGRCSSIHLILGSELSLLWQRDKKCEIRVGGVTPTEENGQGSGIGRDREGQVVWNRQSSVYNAPSGAFLKQAWLPSFSVSFLPSLLPGSVPNAVTVSWQCCPHGVSHSICLLLAAFIGSDEKSTSSYPDGACWVWSTEPYMSSLHKLRNAMDTWSSSSGTRKYAACPGHHPALCFHLDALLRWQRCLSLCFSKCVSPSS